MGAELEFSDGALEQLCSELAGMCGGIEAEDAWPRRQLELLAESGVLGWVIPRAYGGSEASESRMIAGYERLAAACLVTTFVLTQRNGACQRLAGSENESLKLELLPKLARGELFATVGISHLTTSRQHLRAPVVHVSETTRGFRLNGEVPWVTGNVEADYVLTGGSFDDGRQILVFLPTDSPGVEVQAPGRLLALNASKTGSILLDNVDVDRHYLLAGPVEKVMSRGLGGGTGSLTTSSLAVGHAGGILERLGAEAARRPDLVESAERLAAEHSELSARMYRSIELGADSDPELSTESIRKRANSLVLRTAQAYLAASKGAGFVAGHPAERAVREAMFFLVWSCPQPVVAAALREFSCGAWT